MIDKCFFFLEGIGKKTQENLKSEGISDWDSFISAKMIKGIGKKRKGYYDRKLAFYRKALYDGDASAFIGFPEPWRLYDHFRDECVYLDIEVTGVSKGAYATVIGLYDGYRTKIMIKDVNLDIDLLKKELSNYKMIVTFNGTVHDIPFLEKRCPGLMPKAIQFDLRFLCERIGLRGGLKEIEKKLGIERNRIVTRLHNGDVLKLWKMYRASGDDHYLKLLVEYNEEDVINLETIARYAIKKVSG